MDIVSSAHHPSQRETVLNILEQGGIVRLSELRARGVTAATVSRMERAGKLVRLARGLYQLADAPLDSRHNLAEAAKRVPKGVICLVSALAFHGLTDHLPKKVWLAIGKQDWAPRTGIRIIRFTEAYLADEVEIHEIEGVPVKVFGVAKTVADCFRHRNKIGMTIAIEGLREALRQRKASPSDIAQAAERGGIWSVMRPYLETLTTNG